RNTTLTNLQGNVFFFRVEISGTVFNDANRDGRRQFTERGLSGQTVQLLDAVSGALVATTTTDARGNYRFTVANGLGLGRFRVVVAPSGNLAQTTRSLEIDLTRGDTFVTGQDLGVAPTR